MGIGASKILAAGCIEEHIKLGLHKNNEERKREEMYNYLRNDSSIQGSSAQDSNENKTNLNLNQSGPTDKTVDQGYDIEQKYFEQTGKFALKCSSSKSVTWKTPVLTSASTSKSKIFSEDDSQIFGISRKNSSSRSLR